MNLVPLHWIRPCLSLFEHILRRPSNVPANRCNIMVITSAKRERDTPKITRGEVVQESTILGITTELAKNIPSPFWSYFRHKLLKLVLI